MTSTPTDRIDELTAFEITQAERACGIAYETLATRKEPGDFTPGRTALLGALAWVHSKRSEPTLTYEEYMRRVRPEEITEYLFPDLADEPEDDTDAGFPEAENAPRADAGADPRELARVGAGGTEGPVLPGDGRPAE